MTQTFFRIVSLTDWILWSRKDSEALFMWIYKFYKLLSQGEIYFRVQWIEENNWQADNQHSLLKLFTIVHFWNGKIKSIVRFIIDYYLCETFYLYVFFWRCMWQINQ